MANTDYISTDFHAIPAAFSILANAARKANPDVFQQSADMLDMAPSQILRGLSYASYCLVAIPDGEENPEQMKLARRSIGEIMELMAVLIEHQNDAGVDALVAECRARSKS